MTTYFPSGKGLEQHRQWHVVDADGLTVGRLASKVAHILMGKHKPTYTPFLDTGDHVIVINASKVVLKGDKLDDKFYRRHTGFPGRVERDLRPRSAGEETDATGRACGQRHVAQDQAGPPDGRQAQSVRRGRTSARGAKTGVPSGRGEITTESGIQERFQQVAEMQYYGTGRRKSATARVYLRPGGGNFKVNGAAIDSYFKNEALRMIIRQPLQLTDTVNKFDVVVNVDGGGVAGQAGAVRHGIARALLEFNAELRKKLKKAGLLTRDPRAKERKKYGQKGARKRFQFSKR
jgi:small subunit ribosomal protein S9